MEYLEELYGWISSEDNTFGERYTLDEFRENMNNDEYATRMYTWISSIDETFPNRYELDYFVEKVKKKDSSPNPSITTTMEDAGLSEEEEETPIETGESPTDQDSLTIEPTEVPKPIEPIEGEEVEETETVVPTELDDQQTLEYTSLTQERDRIDNDPFQNALDNIEVDKDEDFLVPDYNYRFREYGFEFKEAVPGVDAVEIISSNINPQTGQPFTLTVALDNKDDKLNQQSAQEIKDFLTLHRKESKRLSEVEEKFAIRQSAFQNKKEIEDAVNILNLESIAFNNRVKEFASKQREFVRLDEMVKTMNQQEINTPFGISLLEKRDRMQLEIQQEKRNILAEDVVLNNKGAEIDRLAGAYTQMKAEQGDFTGMTGRGIFKGIGREASFVTDLMSDILVSDYSPLDAIGGGRVKYGAARYVYELAFLRRAAELGYLKNPVTGKPVKSPEELKDFEYEFTSNDGVKSTTRGFEFDKLYNAMDKDQRDDVDSYIKDILRKDVKYGTVTIDGTTGEVLYEKPEPVARYSDVALKEQMKNITEDGMVPMVRTGLDIALGDKQTTDEYMDLTREGFWGGAWLGLSESLPAMLGAGKYGWVQRTAQMFAQVSDHLNEEMMNDPDFATITENEKRMVSLPIGIVVGALEAYGFRNVINQKGLLNKYVLKGLQKYNSPMQTKGLTFRQVVQNEIKNDLLKGTLIIGAGGLAEFETGMAQELADISGKSLYNYIKDKDMFQTPESVADGVRQVLYAGAQEMVGGWVMSTIPATAIALSGKDYAALSDPVFKTFETISQDPQYYTFYVQELKNEINAGNIDKEQAQQNLDLLNDIRSIIPKVPTDLELQQRKEAIALLLNKNRLLRKREQTAPELRGKVDKEISKVDKLLKEIIEGGKTIQGTEGRIEEEEEVTTEQAQEFLDNVNETRNAFGLKPLEQTDELIEQTKVQIKKQRDASKKQSPVQKTGEVESQTTEEVVEGVPNELQESTGETQQDTQEQTSKKKKKKVDDQVKDIQEFEGETETDVVEQESDFGVEQETELETEDVSKDGKVKRTKAKVEVDTKVFEPVVRFAKRAGRAISRVLPKVNIILHESSENFKKATNRDGKGFYDPTNQNIHIDLSKGDRKTVAHEVFHALLLNSVKTNAQARAITKRMVAAVAKAKGLTKEQKQKIEEFISNYDADIQNEEKLAEILGILADGYTKLDAPAKSRVRRWVEAIAKRLGLDINQFTKTDQDIIDLLNTVASKIREGKVITQKDVKAIKTPKKTQKQKVKDVLGEVEVATIKQITKITGLPEPTVRRILGQGAKNGELTRVAAGVYTLKTKDGKTTAIVQGADALTEIKKLVKEGAKFDMIFLDPPYDAPGLTGGNRNLAKYKKITPEQFNEFVGDVVKLLRNENSPVIFMFSASKSNKRKLQMYSKAFENNGLKPSGVAIETGKKYSKSGKPKKMFGVLLKEWVFTFSLSGKQRTDMDFNFEKEYSFREDSKYQTAKPVALLEAIIEASTKAGELILDPFAGSGSTAKAAVRKGRSIVTIEENVEQAEKIKKEVKQEQQKKKEKGDQLDIFEGREQKDIPQRSRKLAESYMMNLRGFISARALFDPGRLRRELEAMGMRLGTARNEFTGEITGYYFQRVSRNGKPYFYNPFGRQQKNIDSAAGNLNDLAATIVRLRDANFDPEAIKEYLISKKNFDTKEVNALMGVSNFVLRRVPESFSKIPGGILRGIKLFDRINKYREGLINKNLTPYGKKLNKLQQELEVLKSQKNKKRAIKKVEQDIENLKKKNKGAKVQVYTQTQITDMVIEFMKKQPAYIEARAKKGLSTLQAQMEMQIAKSFDATPSVNMANKIRLATAIVNMRAREKDSSRLKSALRNFVRAVLPPEDYSKPETISLIKEIQDATPENLQKVKEKILGIATTKIVKGLEGKIKNVLNKNFAKIEGGRAKANIVSASAIKILDQIKSEFATILKSKNGEALAAYEQKIRLRLEKLSEKTIQNDDAFAEQAALELILQYAGAQEMDNTDIGKVAALNEILTNLNSIISEGKSELEQQKRESYHTYLKDFEIAWYSITGKKIEMLIQNPNFDPQLPEMKGNERMILNPEANKLMDEFSSLTDAKKNKARSWPVRNLINLKTGLRRFLITKRLDLPSLIEYMTKIPGKMFEGQFAEITSDLVDQASNDYKFFQMQDKASLENILREIYGKDYQKAVKEESLIRDTDIAKDLEAYEKAKKEYEKNKTEENKAKLDIATFRFSPMEMAYLVYQYKDPANRAGFETKFGEQYERIMYQMEQFMEEKHSKTMALGEWMRSEAYPSLYERYNTTYKKVYRVDMPWNQYYIGPIRRENQEVQDIDLLATGANSWQNTAAPGSTKVRIQNKKALATENLLESFVSYQEKMNWFAAYAPTVNRVNKLIKNPRLKKIIEINYPEGTYGAVNSIIEKIASKGLNKLSQGDIFFNKATSLFVVGRLGVNPTIFLKQLVSFPTYMNEIGFTNWAANAALSVSQMLSLAKEVSKNSVYIQDRYGRNIIRSLENYKSTKASDFDIGKSNLFRSPYQRLLNAQMFLVKAGDKGAILIGGLPVYLYHKNQYKKSNPGATEQQAIDYAIKRFEKATRSTQQSTDLQNRDYYQDGGVLARTFNMFKTSIIQYLRKEILYFRNANRIFASGLRQVGGLRGKVDAGRGGGSAIGNFARSLRGLLVYHSVLPVMFQYLANGLPGVLAPWDEEDGEDLTRAAILGNINALFFVGDLIQIIGDIYYKKPWSKEITNLPLLEQINALLDKFSRYTSTTNPEKASELLFEIMYEDAPGVVGLNTKSMIRWFNNIKKLVEETRDPKESLLRLFNFSDYQIESKEDRDARKRSRGGLTDREFKLLYPELYKQRKEAQQLPPELKEQIDQLERQRKQLREELLEQMQQ